MKCISLLSNAGVSISENDQVINIVANLNSQYDSVAQILQCSDKTPSISRMYEVLSMHQNKVNSKQANKNVLSSIASDNSDSDGEIELQRESLRNLRNLNPLLSLSIIAIIIKNLFNQVMIAINPVQLDNAKTAVIHQS